MRLLGRFGYYCIGVAVCVTPVLLFGRYATQGNAVEFFAGLLLCLLALAVAWPWRQR